MAELTTELVQPFVDCCKIWKFSASQKGWSAGLVKIRNIINIASGVMKARSIAFRFKALK